MDIDDLADEGAMNKDIPYKIPASIDGILTEEEEERIDSFVSVKLTKSQRRVLSVFEDNYQDMGSDEGLTPKQLSHELSYAPRTVRLAMRELMEKHFINKVPLMRDTRQWIYYLTDAYIASKAELRSVDHRSRSFT